MVAPGKITIDDWFMTPQTLYTLFKAFTPLSLDAWSETPLAGLALNSKYVEPGYCFFACKGNVQDGRHYIQEAVAKGAVAVCYDPGEGSVEGLAPASVPLIPITSLAHQVGVIAAVFYGDPTEGVPVIGVTGTNGKTSVTHCLAHALTALGAECAVLGTMGNGFLKHLTPAPLTTMDPITVQRQCREYRDAGAQGFVLEVSSHALHQGRVAGIHFSHGVFTNLTRDHLDYHGTMEQYGEAKKQLFFQPGLQWAILNGDDPFGRHLLTLLPDKVKPLVFSFEKGEDHWPRVQGTPIEHGAAPVSGQVESPWGTGLLETQMLGAFNFSNCLAVASVLGTLGYPWEAILKAISAVPPIRGRMERYGGGDYPSVIVDFAHTPDALWHVLSTLRRYCSGDLWVVFGCGGERDVGKRCEMGRVAQRWCDRIVLTNDNPRSEDPEVIVQDILQGIATGATPTTVMLDRAMAIEQTIAQAQAGDWVLIAGKGHEDYQVLGEGSVFFSDQKVVSRGLSVEHK